MTDLEDRLRDAFRGLDDGISMPPTRAGVELPPRHRGRLLLVAAAVIAIALAASLSVFVDSGPSDVGVTTQDIAPDVFDQRVTPLCQHARTSRLSPQFATADAYRVVAQGAIELVATMRSSLAALPAPTDDPRLVTRVLEDLDGAEERAQNVLDVAALGRVDALPSAWSPVNEYLDIALRELADHGATACAP